MEPLSDEPNSYRAAALHHLGLMYSVDEFITAAKDARLAVIVVAIVLGWAVRIQQSRGNLAGCLNFIVKGAQLQTDGKLFPQSSMYIFAVRDQEFALSDSTDASFLDYSSPTTANSRSMSPQSVRFGSKSD
jgi:hypothetical protein